MIKVSERTLDESKFKMRKTGVIPGIVYSKSKNQPIKITQRELDKARFAHEPVMQTSMGDMVILRELQSDPVSGKALHVSFQAITKGQKFTAQVPVHLTHPDVNFSNQGMILKTLHTTVEVRATAETMVDHITMDVSEMKVHDLIRVKDLPKIEGVEYMDDEETQVAVLDYVQVVEEADTTQAAVGDVKADEKKEAAAEKEDKE